MAPVLTPRRALLLALLAGTLVGLAGSMRSSPPDPIDRVEDAPVDRARRGWHRVESASDLLDLQVALATVLQPDLQAPGAATARDIGGAPWAPQWRRGLALAAARLGLDSAHLQSSLTTVRDDRSGGYRGPRILHVLSANGDGACRFIVADNDTTAYRTIWLGYVRRHAPGLCGLVAAFGLPGDSIRAWLFSTRARYVRDVDWSRPGPSTPQTGLTIWGFRWALSDRWTEGRLGPQPHWEPRCFVGRRGACQQMVMFPEPPDRAVAFAPGVLSVASDYWYSYSPTSRLFADLIRDGGADRFREFWKSDKPLPQAFQDAYDESLDDWVRAWARRNVVEPPRDAAIFPSVWLGALLLAGLFGGAGVAYASRRTIAS